MGRLIRKIPLTVYRISEGTSNPDGTYTPGGETTVDILCNIQPFRMGDVQKTLPEGLRAEDAVIVYTETLLRTVDQFDGTKADQIELDGRRYEALNVENWARNGLRLDHYKAVFVRQDKLRNGGL